MRTCSRTACAAQAVATLTYVYADSTVVLGPLSQSPEPGTYDLCGRHMERTSAPNGWNVIRLPLDGVTPTPVAPSDDLMALADAVRAIGMRDDDPVPRLDPQVVHDASPARGGHLRLVPSAE